MIIASNTLLRLAINAAIDAVFRAHTLKDMANLLLAGGDTISTPPNAIAHATGMIEQKDMVKTGVIIGALGLVLGYGMLMVLGMNGLI